MTLSLGLTFTDQKIISIITKSVSKNKVSSTSQNYLFLFLLFHRTWMEYQNEYNTCKLKNFFVLCWIEWTNKNFQSRSNNFSTILVPFSYNPDTRSHTECIKFECWLSSNDLALAIRALIRLKWIVCWVYKRKTVAE